MQAEFSHSGWLFNFRHFPHGPRAGICHYNVLNSATMEFESIQTPLLVGMTDYNLFK